MACVNCKDHYFAFSREYLRWKVEKQVHQIKVEKRLSVYEARKLVNTSTPPMQRINLRRFRIWKEKKKVAKAAKNQEAKSTQVSLDSRNSSNDLTGEPGPSKSKAGKDTQNMRNGCLKKIESSIIPLDNPLVNMDDKMDTFHSHPPIRKSPKKTLITYHTDTPTTPSPPHPPPIPPPPTPPPTLP